MAEGVLVHQYEVTADDASALLRVASQHANRKPRGAADVVDTGKLTLPEAPPQL